MLKSTLIRIYWILRGIIPFLTILVLLFYPYDKHLSTGRFSENHVINNIITPYEERLFEREILTLKMERVTYENSLRKFPEKYRETVRNNQNIVPLEIIYNLIYHESGWKEDIVSKPNRNGTKDFGLGQLNSQYLQLFIDKYAKDKKDIFNVFDGNHNLQVAIRLLEYNVSYYLEKGYEQEEALSLGIMAYNCGRGAVNSGRIPKSTVYYLSKISNKKEILIGYYK